MGLAKSADVTNFIVFVEKKMRTPETSFEVFTYKVNVIKAKIGGLSQFSGNEYRISRLIQS